MCPACGRPPAVARASCLYCGTPLSPPAAPAAVAAVEDPVPPPSDRLLVVLDLDRVAAAALAHAAGVSVYDAERLLKRGRFHLHRGLEPSVAEAEAARFAAFGVKTLLVAEAEARRLPLRVLRAERASDGLLRLETAEGGLLLQPAELLLLVSGPITRARTPRLERQRVDTASPDEGFCLHLHRRAQPRPIELDALRLEMGWSATGSVRLELESWPRELSVAHDEGFRRESPALAPAEPVEGALAALRAARSEGLGQPTHYDNLAQFRFYSGWRGAVERRLAGSRPGPAAC